MPFVAPVFAAIGAGISAVATAVGLGAAAGAISAAVINFGVSFLINTAISAIFGKTPSMKAQGISRDLAQPSSAPAYRFVYGETRATGTPVGTPVKGNYIWGAWLLNSRPSDLSTFTLYLDKREVVLSGDAFDMDGPGAEATEEPFRKGVDLLLDLVGVNHVNVWISRGAQTSPPAEFLEDAAYEEGERDDLWKATDAWRGCTIVWLKLRAGESGSRQERWPSTPPLVEVEGKWSLVEDPRTGVTGWSENHALCVRDALMNNPIRGYRAEQLHSSFDADGPNACDEVVNLKEGGGEKRYICGGTLVFNEGEIEDQLNPMMISGAADFIRVGGKLGYAAGVYREPTETLTYLLGEGFEFPDMLPGADLVNQLRVSYLSASRGYETADLTPWDIPGALADDGGVPAVKTVDLPFCPSATQAMRVRKITGLRQRRQERIQGGTLPPEAFNLVGGATVTIALPSPYDALDGVYEIEGIHPGLDPIGESGEVAMRLPASLVKHDAAIYDWVPAYDEEEVFDEEYDGERKGTAEPGAISVTTGDAVNLDTGGTIIPRIRFAFDPSTSGVTGYEWEHTGDNPIGGLLGIYQTGGVIGSDVRDASGKVFGFLSVRPNFFYNIRVRAIGPNGNSDWVEIEDVKGVVDIEIDIPIEGVAVGGAGEITVSFRTPNDPDFRAIEIYGSDTDDSGPASLIGTAIYTSQNTIVSINEGSLGTSVTRYYFARSRGEYASASAFTASVSATTDP
ncbi:phage tail protein [Sulfitobacter pontiacus]